MVQRLRVIGITVLSVLLLTIVGAVSLSPAYAPAPTITLNVSPNPALPNQPVTFSGQVTPRLTSADLINIYLSSGSSCSNSGDIRFIPLALGLAPSTLTPPTTLSGTANSAGVYSTTAPSGFSAGSYSAYAVDISYTATGNSSPCDPFTVSPTIPEYPYGLALLAIFMIIGYGVIRRKIRYD